MIQWEYMVLQVFQNMVIEANGVEVGKKAGTFKNAEGPPLHEYLHGLGRDYWELVGIGPTTGGVKLLPMCMFPSC